MKFSRNLNPNINPKPIAISLYPLKSKYICRVYAIGFIQDEMIVSVTNDLDSSPRPMASNTFLDKPIINLFIPLENFSNVWVLFSNSFLISEYLTMGPATNCGNNYT